MDYTDGSGYESMLNITGGSPWKRKRHPVSTGAVALMFKPNSSKLPALEATRCIGFLIAVVMSAVVSLEGCDPDVEREAELYDKNVATVRLFVQNYPAFGRYLNMELGKAKNLRYGSLKAADRKKQKQMLSQANEVIYSSTLVGHLYSYDGRLNRIRRNMGVLAAFRDNVKYRLKVRRVLANADAEIKKAELLMKWARPVSMGRAIEIIRRAEDMLIKPETRVLRLKKAIKEDKLRKDAVP